MNPIQQKVEQLQQQHGDDFEDFLSFEIPDVEIEYMQVSDDEGCLDGACKI